MAKKYVEPGLYTYAATPTWGTAQDGNGAAKGAATPATTSIVFSGVPSSGTISLAGASVSTTGVIGAANADAAANALATNINATTANVTTTGWRASAVQLRNAVYARGPANGAAAGTCEVMTRQGSAAFNSQNAFVFTLNNVSTSSPTTFSGGADGAWGDVWNIASIWASGVGKFGYGILAATLPFAGSIANGDEIHVRANNVTRTCAYDGGSYNISPAALGSEASPVRIIVGDTTEWSGDSADSTLTYTVSMNSGRAWVFTAGSAAWHCQIDGGADSSGNPRFTILNDHSPTNGGLHYQTGAKQEVWKNVRFNSSAGGYTQVLVDGTKDAGRSTIFQGCVFRTNGTTAFVEYSSGREHVVQFDNCVFDNGTAASPHGGVFSPSGASPNTTIVTGCKFINFVNGSSLTWGSGGNTNRRQDHFRNCVFGNVVNWRRMFVVAAAVYDIASRYCAVSSQFTRDFMLDTPRGCVEHVAARIYPTLNAVLPDGVTNWSWRVHPTTQSGNLPVGQWFECPRIGTINSLADDHRTIELDLAIEQNLSWTKADVSMVVEYVDPGGTQRFESTYDPAGGALTTSTSTWSSESGGQVTFDDGGGTQYFNKRKLVLATEHEVAEGTEVGVWLRIHTHVSASSRFLFVDPDPRIV